jgi:alkanesulfonate monooxygenase SsuD/methylene tetrahydromethanopterin reductase-like flavin-dependent oxidoreductase (luciferase family)
MPRSRDLSYYPVEAYYALFKRAAETPDGFMFQMETPAKAISFRATLHAFRRACERAPAEAARKGVDLAVLRSVYIRITPEGVWCGSMRAHPVVQAIERVLGQSVPLPAEVPRAPAEPAASAASAEAQASLARIMAAMKENDG